MQAFSSWVFRRGLEGEEMTVTSKDFAAAIEQRSRCRNLRRRY